MDFIFGTLATDELKVVHHRAARRGLQHGNDIHPRDPHPGDPVTITVTTGADLPVENVACYYTVDGSEPAGERGIARHGQVVRLDKIETVWDTLVWGYHSIWQAQLPAQPEGTVVRYRIGAWNGGGPETCADWPDVTATAETAADAFFKGRPQSENLTPGDPTRGAIFTYQVDRLTVPDWARAAIIYHIFVDRFYPGRGRDWIQTDDLNGIVGGTLWGVCDKLDYVEALGATCIWLSPTWVSPTHHGYDVTNHDLTEPRFGGDEALHSLIAAAHRRGIRVLLDLACNHISDEHPIFQSALNDPHSEYRDWFRFDDSPLGYRSFFGVKSMPQLNLSHPGACAWMTGIAQRWLREFDADGYRLDYANGPGPNFWPGFRAACKQVKPDCLTFGEIVDAPDSLHVYQGRLDGCLDFHLSDALRRTYGWKTWSEAQFETFAQRHHDYFGGDFLMPVFLDNHDMDRFLYIAGGDKKALRQAAAAQMRQPGPPVIYYGTEVGLQQTVSTSGGMGLHVSRTPMVWDAQQDHDLLAYYQRLIRERKQRQG